MTHASHRWARLVRFASLVSSLALATVLHAAAPASSRAFCGFYVGSADQRLYANATLVVLMRDGDRTALSMQNDYRGPPTAFAMVVPVPVVLHEEDVRVLPRDIFDRVDRLAAPRLVEYTERDPCQPPPRSRPGQVCPNCGGIPELEGSRGGGGDLGVRVEAEFAVGEYDIAILSARDSSGLETWLRRERYDIPRGASEVLRPYVESGTKFFVARVDPARVTFEGGRAVLSPLRFHYDTPEFSLPIRLGLLSSEGEQDLLVHILAREQRYEVANYPNTFIPTNLRVRESVRDDFGAFYESVFRETVARNPRTVVTEYAWAAEGCDPCPGPALDQGDLLTLGADVLTDVRPGSFTLTRLHYRYTRDTLGEDLVFRAAPAVVGGRGVPDANGVMEQAVRASAPNGFQGRYAILHPWTGPIACESPRRGRWGGPPGGNAGDAMGAGSTFARGAAPAPPPSLAAVVEGTLAWAAPTGIDGMAPSALIATQEAPTPSAASPAVSPPNPSPDAPSGCRCGLIARRVGGDEILLTLGGTLAVALIGRRSRRR